MSSTRIAATNCFTSLKKSNLSRPYARHKIHCKRASQREKIKRNTPACTMDQQQSEAKNSNDCSPLPRTQHTHTYVHTPSTHRRIGQSRGKYTNHSFVEFRNGMIHRQFALQDTQTSTLLFHATLHVPNTTHHVSMRVAWN